MRKRVRSSPRPPVHAPVKGPILAYLATVADASTAQICAATKLDSVAVRNALVTLSGPAAQVERRGVSPRHRFAITARGRAAVERMPDAPPPRRLPTLATKMVAGHGDRRETCWRYAQCLDAFSRTFSGPGHCELGCSSYTPAVAAPAEMYARSGRSSQEASMFAGWP